MPGPTNRLEIPEATVARLPLYLRASEDLAGMRQLTVSSDRLAEMAGVNAANVRKDLSYFGSFGTRGVGYDVEHLRREIRRELGLNHDWPCIIVGMGNLGQALANYSGFSERGFVIEGLVDADPKKVGTTIAGVVVSPIGELEALVKEHRVTIGVIATPGNVAQDVADSMARSGINSILNFAPVVLSVPPDVLVRKVDLAVELQILGFYQERRSIGSSV